MSRRRPDLVVAVDQMREELPHQARHNGIERIRRLSAPVILERAAFHYDPAIDYCADKSVKIGEMKIICKYYPLRSLVSGIGNDSKHFLANIQKYNSCFQMTSFGATHIIQNNFMPTFKIQGQICHLLGTLLSVPDADNRFLQIYFMSNSDAEDDNRCAHNPTVKRTIVRELQMFLHQNNNLVNMFKIALDQMPSGSHNSIIRADKTPGGEHTRGFNSPTIDELQSTNDCRNLR
ncbi:hypothetical protein HELRODRAFT_170432 [Helobdella robusta]|uniref:Helitron helicase-like domain-containing protein n=1 Tax=Helobdella robusta TaxID=6412 RepID=T1F320_HELRO|nr:hypothetical protein HELRODRAFT_170432 [Helobdella robusta]ESO07130.1 hypothetical protein HELRODRAFT_170432 [Helobdella robusta]